MTTSSADIRGTAVDQVRQGFACAEAGDGLDAFVGGEVGHQDALALATAWSPAFPFGATANPDATLEPAAVREAVGEMVERIVRPAK